MLPIILLYLEHSCQNIMVWQNMRVDGLCNAKVMPYFWFDPPLISEKVQHLAKWRAAALHDREVIL